MDMESEFEGTNFIKLQWKDIRNRVLKVNPTFAKIVDDLNPDKTFSVYLAYYSYGEVIGDIESPFIPTKSGRSRLSNSSLPKDLQKDLGYGVDSSPMAMVLEKDLEFFIDLKEEGITISWLIYSPGSFFPYTTILGEKNNRSYAPNGLLTISSGARSTFMLPNIGCATNHANLQREFNIKSKAPKNLYEHWNVFKELCNSEELSCDWKSCLIYFSEKWVNKIQNDKQWIKLKLYFHDLAWLFSSYRRNHIYYDIAFSIIQKKRNLKPNPYLVDTARHLFTAALGAAPAYIPATGDTALPMSCLQKVYNHSYGLKKYTPVIMQPTHFQFEQDILPIYYSLQNPSTFVFSPKSRKISSTLFEMRELEHIINIFVEELSDDYSICSDTIIGKVSKEIEFIFYHNKHDRHRTIRSSLEVTSHDPRFILKNFNAKFASDSPFLRGCISIKKKT